MVPFPWSIAKYASRARRLGFCGKSFELWEKHVRHFAPSATQCGLQRGVRRDNTADDTLWDARFHALGWTLACRGEVLVTTHSMEEAEALATRLVVMSFGEVRDLQDLQDLEPCNVVQARVHSPDRPPALSAGKNRAQDAGMPQRGTKSKALQRCYGYLRVATNSQPTSQSPRCARARRW